MEQWIVDFILISILLICIISIIVNIIIIIKNKIKKTKNKKNNIFLILSIILLISDLIYASSHSLYYKYNDWVMLTSNINMVRERYGEFDFGHIEENKSGTVGYYIYTDNSPIMPDHLKHYYYIKYDEWGMVYDVYESCEIGG